MKLRQIAMAAAACCGALASLPSFAITANNYTNTDETTGDTLNIRISGASAQDNGILGSALSLCVAGSVHRYAISNNVVFYCTPDIGTNAGQITVPAGKTKLAIYKYSVGGSYYGVGPVNSNTASSGAALTATGNQLPFLDLAKIASVGTTGTNATTASSFSTSLGSYVNVPLANGSTTITTAATTYIGLSDVEPAFFSTSTSNLTANSVYALIFGVPVTLNIRNALQTQQGLTSGSDTEANMPTLSSAQLTSAYTQLGQTWAGIGVTSGLIDDQIYVARRVDSSGTQKTFEALIARTPNGQGGLKSCVPTNVQPFLAPDTGNAGLNTGDASANCGTATPPTVFSGSGGGDVRNCLIAHNGASRGAIGILTTEDKAGTANWRFVKVDGVAPTQAQAAAGKYRHYVESFLNTRTSGAFATGSALGYSAFVTRLSTDLANPAIIKAINGTDQPFGAAGLMALYTRQSPAPTLDFAGTTSVLPWTKVSGADVNNCQAPYAAGF
ncbi:MAG: hypothetical protein WCJ87_05980 [Burkholderiales bacterium]